MVSEIDRQGQALACVGEKCTAARWSLQTCSPDMCCVCDAFGVDRVQTGRKGMKSTKLQVNGRCREKRRNRRESTEDKRNAQKRWSSNITPGRLWTRGLRAGPCSRVPSCCTAHCAQERSRTDQKGSASRDSTRKPERGVCKVWAKRQLFANMYRACVVHNAPMRSLCLTCF